MSDPNQELHERTFQALLQAAKHLSRDDLSLLSFHCGIASKDVLEALQKHSKIAPGTLDGCPVDC